MDNQSGRTLTPQQAYIYAELTFDHIKNQLKLVNGDLQAGASVLAQRLGCKAPVKFICGRVIMPREQLSQWGYACERMLEFRRIAATFSQRCTDDIALTSAYFWRLGKSHNCESTPVVPANCQEQVAAGYYYLVRYILPQLSVKPYVARLIIRPHPSTQYINEPTTALLISNCPFSYPVATQEVIIKELGDKSNNPEDITELTGGICDSYIGVSWQLRSPEDWKHYLTHLAYNYFAGQTAFSLFLTELSPDAPHN